MKRSGRKKTTQVAKAKQNENHNFTGNFNSWMLSSRCREKRGKSTNDRGSGTKKGRGRYNGKSGGIMRITTSDNYYHHVIDCDQDNCERRYCSKHRLLWRFCDTAKRGVDDYFLHGEPHYVYEWGNCPSCEYEFRKVCGRATEMDIDYWQEERGRHAKHI